MKRAIWLILPFFACLIPLVGLGSAGAAEKVHEQQHPYGQIIPELLAIAYSGGEKLRYAVSYTGGIKLGELHLEVKQLPELDSYELHALVTTDDGAFRVLYPIHDVHVTKVRGIKRLPYEYEVWQKEGYRYQAHRVTRYDQRRGIVQSVKNDEKPVSYRVKSGVHNEFSSFFSSRLMPHIPGEDFIVPTFADKKRHEVVVTVAGQERLNSTVFGTVETMQVMPLMQFKGLYDKKGDTVIWYTSDECRVPVKITSKILIGSLTSELIAYENPACTRYPDVSIRSGQAN